MSKKKTIDWERVNKLCQAGCNSSEIAAFLGIDRGLLYNHCLEVHKVSWSDYKSTQRSSGNAHLKEKQYSIALNGDKVMLIWLGKNRLGQSERHVVEHENRDFSKMSTAELIALRDGARSNVLHEENLLTGESE